MVKVKIMKAISERNDEVAREIRENLKNLKITSINLISSPGSGKTTLIERTISLMKGKINFGVITGDLFTPLDAERVEKAGAIAFQLNTEGSCHLTAPMVKSALNEIQLSGINLLFIENVGNLVCPSVWDIGENYRVVILSVTEGSDKVEKYKTAFYGAGAVVISKIDLLEHCDFSLEKVKADLSAINPRASVFFLSAKTGQGMDSWCGYIERIACAS